MAPSTSSSTGRRQQLHSRGALLAGLALLSVAQLAAGQSCLIVGYPASSLWNNADETCVELWPAPAAPIQFPADTATTKHGQIFLKTTSPVSAGFVDRDNATYGFAASANAPTDLDELVKIWPNLIVKATVSGSNVQSYRPVLYVPYRTLLQPFLNTTFEGNLTNLDPPVGVPETSWFRWTWTDEVTVKNSSETYQNFVNGTFDNLFKSVKDADGTCQPALCSGGPTSDSAACKYYTKFFSNSSNVNTTLQWDPNFNSPSDTKLVVKFPVSGKLYAAPFVYLWQLLKPFTFVPKSLTFQANVTLVNGTVTGGVPFNFTGRLTNSTTRLQTC